MPTIEIITGVAGSGKSEVCRARLLEAPASWLLLPSEGLQARWRRELPAHGGCIKTLHDLTREIGAPRLGGCEVVTPEYRLLILRHLIRERVRPGDYLGAVASTAGF